MPFNEWSSAPRWTSMDEWLQEGKRVGIEHGRRVAEAAAEAKAEADAEAAALAEQKALWRAAHPIGRPQTHRPGSRPWQAAGYAKRADWLADGSPGRLEGD
jgi:hypothetical protein